MDFIPSVSLYDKARKLILSQLASVERAAFVIPHWEALECEGIPIPRNFDELKEQAQSGSVRPFHVVSSRLMPFVKDIATVKSGCLVPPGVWSFGVQKSNYNKWYIESQQGIEGLFPLEAKGPLKDKVSGNTNHVSLERITVIS